MNEELHHYPIKSSQPCKDVCKAGCFYIEENVSLIHRNDLSGTAVEFQRAVEFNGQDGDVLVELLLWHIDIDDARHFAP